MVTIKRARKVQRSNKPIKKGTTQTPLATAPRELPLIYRYEFTETEIEPGDYIFNVTIGGGENHDLLAIASNNSLHLFDITKREIKAGIDVWGLPTSTFILSWSPDGRYLLFADGENVRLRDLLDSSHLDSSEFIGESEEDNVMPLSLYEGYYGSIGAKCVAWSLDSQQFALSDRIYDTRLRCIKELPPPPSAEELWKYDPPSSWQYEMGEALFQRPVIWDLVTNMVIIGDGNFDSLCDTHQAKGYSLELWNLWTDRCDPLGFAGDIVWLEWHPLQREILLIGTGGGTLTYFDVNNRKVLRSVKLVDVVMGIIPVPGTDFLFVNGSGGKIVLYDGKHDTIYNPWPDHCGAYYSTCVTVAKNGKTAIIASQHEIEVYDLQSLQGL